MASKLADRGSAVVVLVFGLVTYVGFMSLALGFIITVVDGVSPKTPFVSLGAVLTPIGALGCVGAFFFRRAYLRAVAATRGAH